MRRRGPRLVIPRRRSNPEAYGYRHRSPSGIEQIPRAVGTVAHVDSFPPGAARWAAIQLVRRRAATLSAPAPPGEPGCAMPSRRLFRWPVARALRIDVYGDARPQSSRWRARMPSPKPGTPRRRTSKSRSSALRRELVALADFSPVLLVQGQCPRIGR